ncbi:MAG: hypothetical protein ABSH51_04720 [Solirubrobacteraceae bacterium]|jgi:hypothetical protein
MLGAPTTLMRTVPAIRITLAVLLCALVTAACGSAGVNATGTGTSASPAESAAVYNAFLKFSTCMRAHGVPNFPDPRPGGGGIQITAGSGLNPQSPAFASARQTCRRLLPGGGPHALTEAQRVAAIANAQCMREHGVPNFPDPKFPAGGGIMQQLPGINPSSPAFQNATKHCPGP